MKDASRDDILFAWTTKLMGLQELQYVYMQKKFQESHLHAEAVQWKQQELNTHQEKQGKVEQAFSWSDYKTSEQFMQ